jgi:hypothetical protein
MNQPANPRKAGVLRLPFLAVLAVGWPLLICQPTLSAPTGMPVSPLLFGMDVGKPMTPWPPRSASGTKLPIKVLRMWDNGTSWNLLNPSEGVYRWDRLDMWVGRAVSEGMQVLYVFGITPDWAANGNPRSKCSEGPRGCLPPKELNADGTGTDAVWKKFVRDLVSRYKGRIRYYELWNERNAKNFWQGTPEQSVRMAKDAWEIIKQLDPDAKVVSPSLAHGDSASLDAYLTACGPSCPYQDIISVHGRAGRLENAQPEAFETIADAFRTVMAKHGVASLPLWDTEGGWRRQGEVLDPDQQAAYVARAYLIRAGKNLGSFEWYQWDNGFTTSDSWGGLFDRASGKPTPAAQAYVEVARWLAGSTIEAPCSAHGSVWTCGLTRADGSEALVVWDTSQSCRGGNCTTSPYRPASQFTAYEDISGKVSPVTGSAVQIGAQPILLEHAPASH